MRWRGGATEWPLESVDEEPAVLTSFERARFVEALHRCATEGVVAIVGDEPTARRARLALKQRARRE